MAKNKDIFPQLTPVAAGLNFVTMRKIFLKGHALLNERWVQEKVAENPAILGLGDLLLKDKERRQPGAGRLDLLLVDAETNRRFEVEIQLGATDESHLIRTLEYWDIEKKRYPDYDHCAVIVAEDITNRFLNIISLFNGSVPLIAIQMSALTFEDKVALTFTTVLGERTLGQIEEDEDNEFVATDRAYWDNRASSESMQTMDELTDIIHSLDEALAVKYTKSYIGLVRGGQSDNICIFRPKKDHVRIEPRIEYSQEIQHLLEDAGLDIMAYDTRWGRYRIRLTKDDLTKNKALVEKMLSLAHLAKSSS